MDLKGSYFVRSHQIFAAALKHLTKTELAKIWHVEHRTLYRWAQDPDSTEGSYRNPMDLLRITFSKLQEIGQDHVVDGALRILAESLGYRVSAAECCSDKGSAVMELLDINKEVGTLADCLQDVLSDGEMTNEEKRAVSSQIDRLVVQAMELKDAVQRGLK